LYIRVHNPQHVSRGVRRVTLDGVEIEGNLVNMEALEGEHQVEAWLGG
jgi:cellobiose phosphorylase